MQLIDGNLFLSASDLVNFLGCTHASSLDLRQQSDRVELPEPDPSKALIQKKGLEHERAYLAGLKASGRQVVEIAGNGLGLAERVVMTRQAMRSGAEVIYQAALVTPPWLGYADFLERVDEPSELGPWGY